MMIPLRWLCGWTELISTKLREWGQHSNSRSALTELWLLPFLALLSLVAVSALTSREGSPAARWASSVQSVQGKLRAVSSHAWRSVRGYGVEEGAVRVVKCAR